MPQSEIREKSEDNCSKFCNENSKLRHKARALKSKYFESMKGNKN